MPEVPTVATPVAVLLHTPPGAISVSVVVAPGQTETVPVIIPATGSGFTVTTRVAASVPQLLVTV
jgi:hypothetical protein